MFNPDLVLAQINTEEEALLIMATLGNTIADWSFIKNIGGPKKALESDLFLNGLAKKIVAHADLAGRLANIRKDLDYFYSQEGFILSPISGPRSRLFKIPQAPLAFLGRFNRQLIDKVPGVSVVGARNACERGLAWSASLGASLAARGINVISGGAQGIDRAAHLGALKQGGTTCQVSGAACSLRSGSVGFLAGQDRNRFALIYPFGPFFPQGKYMFVERNRYVAGLADALIVVQGQEGSGTLHTVKFAEALNIPIYAVPGAIDHPLSYVPNQLLQKGRARAIADFDQIAEALVTNVAKAPKKCKKAPEELGARPEAQSLPEVLMLIKNHGNSLSMSQILSLSGKGFLAMQKELLLYELEGRIIKQGSQFVLTGR